MESASVKKSAWKETTGVPMFLVAPYTNNLSSKKYDWRIPSELLKPLVKDLRGPDDNDSSQEFIDDRIKNSDVEYSVFN